MDGYVGSSDSIMLIVMNGNFLIGKRVVNWTEIKLLSNF